MSPTDHPPASTGPLRGVRVVELAGIGPGPFAAMILADLGADVVSIDRPAPDVPTENYQWDLLRRGRESIAVDLKSPAGVQLVLRLVENADVLIEGYRPGVAERLGLGPDECRERNPLLVYGRMTGWGQDGPYAHQPGHDLNYIAMAGAASHIGPAGGPPVPPLNLVGDFGGGGMLLVVGVLAALHEATRSGHGQVIDAAMVDGTALLTTMFHGLAAQGSWNFERGSNLLDGGAHFYGMYETADSEYISFGSIEPQFYSELLRVLELDSDAPDQWDASTWPEMRKKVAGVVLERTRSQWAELLDNAGLCFAPVMNFVEATDHPHMVARNTFVTVEGVRQPAPAPRFSRTPGAVRRGPRAPGHDSRSALTRLGFSPAEIDELEKTSTVVSRST